MTKTAKMVRVNKDRQTHVMCCNEGTQKNKKQKEVVSQSYVDVHELLPPPRTQHNTTHATNKHLMHMAHRSK